MVPGQGVAMVLRQSIMGGPSAAFLSSLGNCLGIMVWSTSSAVGLSAIFTRSETAYAILKWSGVSFLAFISLQTFLSLRKEFGKFDLESSTEFSAWGSFRLGLVTNLTNAKAAVYAVAFIPAFIPMETSLAFGTLPRSQVATSPTPILLPLWQHQGYATSQSPWLFENTRALLRLCNKFELEFLRPFAPSI